MRSTFTFASVFVDDIGWQPAHNFCDVDWSINQACECNYPKDRLSFCLLNTRMQSLRSKYDLMDNYQLPSKLSLLSQMKIWKLAIASRHILGQVTSVSTYWTAHPKCWSMMCANYEMICRKVTQYGTVPSDEQ